MPRWLLPLIAVLALCGKAVTAYAAAGWVGDLTCCCPDPATCKCHDHDGQSHKQDVMKRCSVDAKQIAPDSTSITIPAPAPAELVIAITPAVAVDAPALLSAPPVPPEPPPI